MIVRKRVFMVSLDYKAISLLVENHDIDRRVRIYTDHHTLVNMVDLWADD